MILVDTGVLLNVLEDDSEWGDCSQANLDAATATDELAINPIIYSELGCCRPLPDPHTRCCALPHLPPDGASYHA